MNSFVKNLGIIVLLFVISFLTFTLIFNKNFQVFTNKNFVYVYFVKQSSSVSDKRKTFPVKRKIKAKQKPLNFAIKELLTGPTSLEKNSGYHSEIPSKTKIIEINETPNRVIIDLSKEFSSGGGSLSMHTRLEQIIFTALDAEKQKPVYLKINGREIKYLGGEGVEVPQPLSRNINKDQRI